MDEALAEFCGVPTGRRFGSATRDFSEVLAHANHGLRTITGKHFIALLCGYVDTHAIALEQCLPALGSWPRQVFQTPLTDLAQACTSC